MVHTKMQCAAYQLLYYMNITHHGMPCISYIQNKTHPSTIRAEAVVTTMFTQ